MSNCKNIKLIIVKRSNSTKDLFNCPNVMCINILTNFNTETVTDMSSMFKGCKKLKTLNLSSFNSQNVNYKIYMFSGCSSLNRIIVNKNNNNELIKQINHAGLKKEKPIAGTNLIQFTRE